LQWKCCGLGCQQTYSHERFTNRWTMCTKWCLLILLDGQGELHKCEKATHSLLLLLLSCHPNLSSCIHTLLLQPIQLHSKPWSKTPSFQSMISFCAQSTLQDQQHVRSKLRLDMGRCRDVSDAAYETTLVKKRHWYCIAYAPNATPAGWYYWIQASMVTISTHQ
jgi:hypothetical protein